MMFRANRFADRRPRDTRALRTACIATLSLLASAGAAQAASAPAASAGPPAATQLPAPPASGEMGFVFSAFVDAVYPGMQDACPDGLANLVRDNFLSTLPLEERARLQKPENEPELTKRWKAYGFSPDHRMNVCANYDKFDHPLYKTVQSKIAYGVNLDGDASGEHPHDPYVCPHQKFVSPIGEKGIDNQYYRAMGCERNHRGPDGKVGDVLIGDKSALMSDYTIVMILRNVHSLVNDDNVEVLLASSQDKPIVDSQQNFVRNASYHVTKNPKWRNVLRGHIVNGVLTTESSDIVLERQLGNKPRGVPTDWNFARSRLKIVFKPDGTLDGVIGGYVPLIMYMLQAIGGSAGTVTVADMDCSSQYRTIKALADGERDPATGQCDRISSAMHIEAVPAFVFDHTTTTAEAN
jgi:hypothetical protein